MSCSSADFVLSRIYSSFRTTKELWSKVLLEEEEQEQVLGGWAYNVVMDCEQNPNFIFDISMEGMFGSILIEQVFFLQFYPNFLPCKSMMNRN